jgi:hypothetical protein
MNPMPDTTCAAIRVWSATADPSGAASNETVPSAALATPTTTCVGGLATQLALQSDRGAQRRGQQHPRPRFDVHPSALLARRRARSL